MKKNQKPKHPKADLLALACLLTSREGARWICFGEKKPDLHSPQNIIRVLDTFTSHLGEITDGFKQAKAAVEKREWRKTRKLIANSLAALNSFGPGGEDLLELVKNGEQDYEKT
jgi:hypothetical protein